LYASTRTAAAGAPPAVTVPLIEPARTSEKSIPDVVWPDQTTTGVHAVGDGHVGVQFNPL
jgi:hypothetical protein